MTQEQQPHDFYYSKKRDKHLNWCAKYMWTEDSAPLKRTFVNGIEYNEMILSGKTPYTIENGDLELVYSGNDYKITLEDRL